MGVLSRTRCRTVLAGALLLSSLTTPAGAQPERALSEPEAKAAFLYNLALFATWPATAQAPRDLTICILGRNPIKAALEALAGTAANGRPIIVRTLQGADDPRGCHILFVPAGTGSAARATLLRVEEAPVLTVGDDDAFLRMGGMVRVYLERSRLRFEVNADRVEQSGVRLSSKVLNLARVVREADFVP